MIILGVILFSFEILVLSSLTFYVGMVQNPDIAIDLSYKAIYYYSKIEMNINNLKKKIMKFIKNNQLLNRILIESNKKKIYNDIDIIKNGNIILSTNKDNLLSDHSNVPIDYDFIVYSDYSNLEKNNYVLHKKIFRTIPKNLDEFECQNVDYKFIMMEIIVNNNQIPVELSNNKHNYLIVNNKLDEQFIKYYLKKYLFNQNISTENETIFNYTLKYIDHNVNIGEIDNTHIIIINQNELLIEKNE